MTDGFGKKCLDQYLVCVDSTGKNRLGLFIKVLL